MILSHHSHNINSSLRRIGNILKNNQSIALVTDAGTPGISDPGQEVVAMCGAAGIPVVAVPGNAQRRDHFIEHIKHVDLFNQVPLPASLQFQSVASLAQSFGLKDFCP